MKPDKIDLPDVATREQLPIKPKGLLQICLKISGNSSSVILCLSPIGKKDAPVVH